MQHEARPMVSIVVNNYNYGRFLAPAIQSALDQTYNPLEVIVVDDGSTDNSREVISSFGGRIKTILKPNAGQGSAYNAGLKASSGFFIHFLDADDLLETNAVEEAVAMWEPGVAKVHFYLRVIEGIEGKQTHLLTPASRLADGDVKGQISNTGWYMSAPGSGNLYCRPVLDRFFPMPEPEWVTWADTFPIFLAPLFGEVRACEKVLGSYRVHGANHAAQTEVSPALLKFRIDKEAQRDALLAEFCPAAGVAYAAGAVQKDLTNMKLRFSSLVMDSAGGPQPDRRMWQIARQMIPACWAKADWSIPKRLAFTAWTVYLLFAPKRFVSAAIDLMFVPSKRRRPLQRLA